MTVHAFDIEIAERVGVHAAIIHEHLRMWVKNNADNKRNFHDGRYWTHNTREALSLTFPYLTVNQIRTAVDKLRDAGLAFVGNFNKHKYDRTLWYSVDQPLGKIPNGVDRDHPPIPSSNPSSDPSSPPIPPEGDLLGPISQAESSPPTTPKDAPSQAGEQDRFEEFWNLYPKCPRKTDRPKARKAFHSIVQGRHKEIAQVDADTIIQGLERYARRDPDPKFIPLPTTWLNGARWEEFAAEPAGVSDNAKALARTWREELQRGDHNLPKGGLTIEGKERAAFVRKVEAAL